MSWSCKLMASRFLGGQKGIGCLDRKNKPKICCQWRNLSVPPPSSLLFSSASFSAAWKHSILCPSYVVGKSSEPFDFTMTWCSSWHAVLWCGLPKIPLEHIVPVDQFGLWRQHQIWAINDSEQLRNLLTQRFSSNVVFLSLLLSTEIGVCSFPPRCLWN